MVRSRHRTVLSSTASPEKNDWSGPFNTLLFELFPPSEHYQITPQHKSADESQDFAFRFIIRKRRAPVFFEELKTYRPLKNLSARALAGDQMRDHIREFSSNSIPMPKLMAFGTQFCIYTFSTKTRALEPKLILAMPTLSTTSRRRIDGLSVSWMRKEKQSSGRW